MMRGGEEEKSRKATTEQPCFGDELRRKCHDMYFVRRGSTPLGVPEVAERLGEDGARTQGSPLNETGESYLPYALP